MGKKKTPEELAAELEALEERQKAEVAAIKEKRKKQRDALKKRMQKIEAKDKRNQRRSDTRRKVLLGAYLMERMEKSEEVKARVMKGLDSFLTRPQDRELFELAEPSP